MSAPRREAASTPRLSTIARWWYENARVEDGYRLLQFSYIGMGEPFCFRCGWLSPESAKPIDVDKDRGASGISRPAGWSARTTGTPVGHGHAG